MSRSSTEVPPDVLRLTERPAPRGKRPTAITVTTVLALGLALAVLLVDMPKPAVGGLVILLSILLLMMRVHIGLAMVLASVIGLYGLGGTRVVAGTLQQSVFNGTANWQLSVIPMFVLMGIVMYRGGVTDGTFVVARNWLSRLPGGLAVSTTYAGAMLAASSGSSMAVSYSLGRMAIPQMLKSNYSPALATGSVQMAGTLGQLMPPSVMLVIYATTAQVAVGPQLLAAIVPALCLATVFALVVIVWVMLRPQDAPKADVHVSWRERFRSLTGVLPLLAVMLTVMLGIYLGVFTATEAGAYGVLVAFVVAFVIAGRGKRGPRVFGRFAATSVMHAVTGTATIFLLLIGVLMLNRVIALSQIPQYLSDFIADAGFSRVGLCFMLLVLYIVLGTALEPLAMILLTVPILIGPLQEAGVDLIWFGIFVIILGEIAVVSPPVGMISFIVHRLSQDPEVNGGREISITAVFAGVTPFVLGAIAFIVLIIFFPDIVTFIPNLAEPT